MSLKVRNRRLMLILFFTILLFVRCSHNGFGQYMPGEVPAEEGIETVLEDYKANDTFLGGVERGPGPLDLVESNKEFESFVIDRADRHLGESPSEAQDISSRSLLDREASRQSTGQTLTGTFDEGNEYISTRKIDLMRSISNKGRSGFGLNYYQNNFNYKDSKNIFKKTFQDDKDAVNVGFLEIEFQKFFMRYFIDLGIVANISAGFNRGVGLFQTSQTKSHTEFKIWTIPIDLGLSLEIPVSTWIKLCGSGGATLAMLSQNRNDLKDDDSDKTKIQMGTGYFAEAKFRFALSNAMASSGAALYSSMGITKQYFNIMARMHNLSNFQDDITISGVTFGVGITFEYL
ncbi:MAG: hypothetical protein A2504_05145 [Bdellovibrionales bacterium RIFOXYD12_FULL_39_22]|nr:MAG: hypothetical protein A2385_06680 [Bdellovibrionales bacterium RIFOXYB1_FULL_39_21]OFZ41957.1 MAG: hypothetical protein A2485_08650 [Bdellovibrionales bacterium RIFOXYC12_FULL_39_17]OFZ93668.1 MAG: hypothetical protein A2504_05145 [Bdellovibrionales bacterium RIFOXYD12_FULL_39_22]HLE10197.1 hypothetical protein [Bacteriovoracaceae bacterium]